MEHIEIESCFQFDFIDDLTLIVSTREGQFKYNKTGSKWTQTAQVGTVEQGFCLRCIGNNIYVGSLSKGLVLLSPDGSKQETLAGQGCFGLTVFNDTLCYVNNEKREVQRFKDNEKLEPLTLPYHGGLISTLESSQVLLIAGDSGYSIYDKEF